MKVLAQGFNGFNETTGLGDKLESELERITIQQPELDYPVEISGRFSEFGKIEIEKRINHNGPLKDTIILQGAGWAFVEVELTNPGIWAIHCHSGQHANAGMMQLLQIGDKFTKTPDDWPTCNSFSSGIDRSDFENLFSEQNKVKFPFVASDNEIEKVMNSDGTISTGDGNCVSVKKAKNGAKVYSTICPTNFDNATFDNATFNPFRD